MMPKRSNTRRPRKNGNPITTSNAFEKSLALRKDRVVQRDSCFLQVLAITGVTSSALAPQFLSTRTSSMSALYLRYRIREVVFRILPVGLSAGGVSGNIVPVGIFDDDGATSPSPPTTVAQITQLRCSRLVGANQTVPTDFVWVPIDKSKWYYCQAESTGDPRLIVQASIFTFTAPTDVLSMQVFYSIEFEGSV